MFGLILVALRSKTKSVAARLLELRVRMPLTAWMFFSCVFVCRVDGGLCYELIIRSEESYRVCASVCVRDRETSTVRLPRPKMGYCATKKNPQRAIMNFVVT